MSTQRTDNWSAGANNVAQPERLPQNSVAALRNLDPAPGGRLTLRAGFDKVQAFTNARALFAAGDALLVVDGGDLHWFDTRTNSATLAATVDPAAPVAAVWHNGELLVSTPQESFALRAGQRRAWGIPAPVFDVQLVAGALPAGTYKVAVTATVDGMESGCLPLTVTLDGTQDIRVVTADSRAPLVYASTTNGQTLYAQGEPLAGAFRLTYVADDTARLQTALLTTMPACTRLASLDGLVVGAAANVVYHSEPLWHHLHDPVRGFVLFPADVTMLVDCGRGVYASTDEKVYFITRLGTDQVALQTASDVPAQPGTEVKLPDGRVAWFTRYGQAFATGDGAVELPNATTYAPTVADLGAAGVLEHNGNQMVVTALRGSHRHNALRAGDYWDLEVFDD